MKQINETLIKIQEKDKDKDNSKRVKDKELEKALRKWEKIKEYLLKGDRIQIH